MSTENQPTPQEQADKILPEGFLPKGAEVTEVGDINVGGHKGKLIIIDRSKVESHIRDQPDVEEGEENFLSIAEGIVAGQHLDGIRVPDSKDPEVGDFPLNNAEDYVALMRYIETNLLQDVAPWSAVYKVYKALMAYGEHHP
jgi:hypothetical protein